MTSRQHINAISGSPAVSSCGLHCRTAIWRPILIQSPSRSFRRPPLPPTLFWQSYSWHRNEPQFRAHIRLLRNQKLCWRTTANRRRPQRRQYLTCIRGLDVCLCVNVSVCVSVRTCVIQRRLPQCTARRTEAKCRNAAASVRGTRYFR